MTIDHAAGARAVVAHLVSLARRRIAFVKGDDVSTAGQERYRGYCVGLAEAGIALEPALVEHGHFTMEGGDAATRRLLARPRAQHPDAIFYASDAMALAGMHQLHAAGVQIPDDIAVAGYGNIAFAAISAPPLTTVRVSKAQLGSLAAGMLQEGMARPGYRPADIEVEAVLVIRASTVARAASSAYDPLSAWSLLDTSTE